MKKEVRTREPLFLPKILTAFKGYTKKHFFKDVVSGILVGLLALPLAMAFAIASGLPPERGLTTAVVAGFLISVFGGSRVQIGGPTGAFVVLVGTIMLQHGMQGLLFATLMAGAILILMGLTRMGAFLKFIPYTVVVGFTAGIAVVIFTTQVADLFGLHPQGGTVDFFERWAAIIAAWDGVDAASAGLGFGTIALIAFWPARLKKIPPMVVALVAATFVSLWFGLEVDTIGSRYGSIPAGLPAPHFPAVSWSLLKELVQPAVVLALLAAIETLLSAVVSDGMIDSRHRSNTELVGVGIANLVSPLFGGLPATGAVARTVTNIKNGGRTPVAGIVHSVTLLAILMLGGALAQKIPMAAMAGILVVVSYHMSEWKTFRALLKSERDDVAVMVTTFLLTVIVDLTVAVEVGMVLAAFLFMKKMADLTRIKSVQSSFEGGGDDISLEEMDRTTIPENIQVIHIQGSIFFGAAERLLETIRDNSSEIKGVILNLRGALHMDATGIRAIERIKLDFEKTGGKLILAGLHSQPMMAMQRAGKYEQFGEECFTGDIEEALVQLSEL